MYSQFRLYKRTLTLTGVGLKLIGRSFNFFPETDNCLQRLILAFYFFFTNDKNYGNYVTQPYAQHSFQQ